MTEGIHVKPQEEMSVGVIEGSYANRTEEWSCPIFKKRRYQNPWDDWKTPKLSFKILKYVFTTKHRIPSQKVLDQTLPIAIPDFPQFSTSPSIGIRHMWIGHATSLVQFDGITFLTDPIFSTRCSPSQKLGPKRYRPPACTVKELPHIDFVIISHNHYDHLDFGSVVALNERFGNGLRWYVPVGLKCWMNRQGCTNVIELSWWHEHIHDEKLKVKIVSTPCYHWCKRTLLDDNKVLWTSWCVIGPNHRFYFAGDTGYCPGFKEIGRKYGPFTLATIPIGAYHPRWYLKHPHVDPGEAVDIHNDIHAETSIGIHWGTFPLAYENYLEPREKLKEELASRGMSKTSFVTVGHGEVVVIGGEPNRSCYPDSPQETHGDKI